MVDNIQIPKDVSKVIEVTVKDTSDPLRKFLVSLTNKINQLEKRIKVLEDGN